MMCLNLYDHQTKIDCYILRMLYTNLMVTVDPKPIIDSQKKQGGRKPT